jgi:hypothetical protein
VKDGQGLFHEVGVGEARGGDRQAADLVVERKELVDIVCWLLVVTINY